LRASAGHVQITTVYHKDTGEKASEALLHIAEQIDVIHRKGLHFRPRHRGLVLREFVRINL